MYRGVSWIGCIGELVGLSLVEELGYSRKGGGWEGLRRWMRWDREREGRKEGRRRRWEVG